VHLPLYTYTKTNLITAVVKEQLMTDSVSLKKFKRIWRRVKEELYVLKDMGYFIVSDPDNIKNILSERK
jgi:hypothetical protein